MPKLLIASPNQTALVGVNAAAEHEVIGIRWRQHADRLVTRPTAHQRAEFASFDSFDCNCFDSYCKDALLVLTVRSSSDAGLRSLILCDAVCEDAVAAGLKIGTLLDVISSRQDQTRDTGADLASRLCDTCRHLSELIAPPLGRVHMPTSNISSPLLSSPLPSPAFSSPPLSPSPLPSPAFSSPFSSPSSLLHSSPTTHWYPVTLNIARSTAQSWVPDLLGTSASVPPFVSVDALAMLRPAGSGVPTPHSGQKRKRSEIAADSLESTGIAPAQVPPSAPMSATTPQGGVGTPTQANEAVGSVALAAPASNVAPLSCSSPPSQLPLQMPTFMSPEREPDIVGLHPNTQLPAEFPTSVEPSALPQLIFRSPEPTWVQPSDRVVTPTRPGTIALQLPIANALTTATEQPRASGADGGTVKLGGETSINDIISSNLKKASFWCIVVDCSFPNVTATKEYLTKMYVTDEAFIKDAREAGSATRRIQVLIFSPTCIDLAFKVKIGDVLRIENASSEKFRGDPQFICSAAKKASITHFRSASEMSQVYALTKGSLNAVAEQAAPIADERVVYFRKIAADFCRQERLFVGTAYTQTIETIITGQAMHVDLVACVGSTSCAKPTTSGVDDNQGPAPTIFLWDGTGTLAATTFRPPIAEGSLLALAEECQIDVKSMAASSTASWEPFGASIKVDLFFPSAAQWARRLRVGDWVRIRNAGVSRMKARDGTPHCNIAVRTHSGALLLPSPKNSADIRSCLSAYLAQVEHRLLQPRPSDVAAVKAVQRQLLSSPAEPDVNAHTSEVIRSPSAKPPARAITTVVLPPTVAPASITPATLASIASTPITSPTLFRVRTKVRSYWPTFLHDFSRSVMPQHLVAASALAGSGSGAPVVADGPDGIWSDEFASLATSQKHAFFFGLMLTDTSDRCLPAMLLGADAQSFLRMEASDLRSDVAAQRLLGQRMGGLLAGEMEAVLHAYKALNGETRYRIVFTEMCT